MSNEQDGIRRVETHAWENERSAFERGYSVGYDRGRNIGELEGHAAGVITGRDEGIEVGRQEYAGELREHPLTEMWDLISTEGAPPSFAIIGRGGESWSVGRRVKEDLYSRCGPMDLDTVKNALAEILSSMDKNVAEALQSVSGIHRIFDVARAVGKPKTPEDIDGRLLIPAAVYYDREACNFYDEITRKGMGESFFRRWADLSVHFPRSPSRDDKPSDRDYKPGDIISLNDPGGPPNDAPGVQAYGGHPKPGVLELRAAMRLLIRYSHGNSIASGWWPERPYGEGHDRVGPAPQLGQRNFGELIALIHSEISEALEGYRKNKEDEHLPQYLNVTVELADALHRIFDLAGAMGVSLAEAYVDKGEFNLVRPDHKKEAREAPGGKQF